MNKVASLLLVGCIVSFSSFAQTSLWKISKNGNTLFLGGTIHLLRASDYPLPAEYDKAYNQSDMLVLETDVAAMQQPGNVQKLMAQGAYHDERTLQSVLQADTYNKLEAEFTKSGITMNVVQKFKPVMACLTLLTIRLQAIGATSEGVDMHFYKKSQSDEKQFAYLESVDTQIDLITKMGDGNEDDYVKKSLKDLRKVEKEFESLLTNWRKGNIEGHEQELSEMKEEFMELYNTMLVVRNKNWMPQIEKFLADDKKELVLVGSLHLHGPDGLITKLKEKGYSVEQY